MKKVTEKQLKEWKDKYGSFFGIELEDGLQCFVKAPTMMDWKRSMSVIQNETETDFAEDILKSNWIDGDEAIKTNDDDFFAAAEKLSKLLEYPDAVITKDGDHFIITIQGKTCKVKPVTRPILKKAERRNRTHKPFATEEQLFDMVKIEADEAFNDRNNAEFRFPLYEALKQAKTQKIATIKKY